MTCSSFTIRPCSESENIMSILHTIFHFVGMVYAFPIKVLHGYESCYDGNGYRACEEVDPSKVGGIMLMVIIYGLTIAILAFLGKKAYDEIYWQTHKKQCQHCKEDTLWVSEGEYPDCVEGDACCEDCDAQHQMAAKAGRNFTCQVDGTVMKVYEEEEQYVHACPSCGLRVMEEPMYDELLCRLRRVQLVAGRIPVDQFWLLYGGIIAAIIVASHR